RSDVDAAEAAVMDRIAAFQRRAPRLRDEVVTLAHGAGGKASAALLESVFLPAFASGPLTTQADAALLTSPSGDRLAFTTDSFVVHPLRFPGGSVGDLAVNGTVNDLAVSGARPLALLVSFILEAGLPSAVLEAEARAIAEAARQAGVQVVGGDTKVVEHGKADGMYITTAGIGRVDP